MARREWIDRDFYVDLGLIPDASADEIEAAYRTLVRGGERSTAVFEAYGVLSDADLRREYDDVRRLFADDDRPVPKPEPDRDDVEDTDETPETPETPVVAGRRVPRRAWLAAGVLALGMLAASYEGWLLYAQHLQTVAAAQALEAAERYTLTLTGVNPDDIDKNFAEVLDGATGEFKDMYAQSSDQLRRLLIENKATAHGTVVDAAVISATKKRVDVLLFVDQAVSNKASPDPQLDRSRIVMTMEKVGGRWLAAKVDLR